MRLSILITYFEEGELIERCLSSLNAQIAGRSDIEILIYDDCSVVRKAKDQDISIADRLIVGERNQGPAYGRNKLLDEARGLYVHFHDADDTFEPGWMQHIDACMKTNVDIILTDVCSYKGARVECEKVMAISRYAESVEDFCVVAWSGFILIPSTTVKRAIVERIKGFNTREVYPQSEDADYHIRLSRVIESVDITSNALVRQNLRLGSHSSNKSAECWKSSLKMLEVHLRDIEVKYTQIAGERAAWIGAELARLGEWKDARRAYAVSHSLRCSYLKRGYIFRMIAMVVGAYKAEQVKWAFRMIKRKLAGRRD